MTHDEFLAVLALESPTLEDYKQVVIYAESASIEVLWAALTSNKINKLFVAVLNKALQEKVVQANLQAAMSNISNRAKHPKPGK